MTIRRPSIWQGRERGTFPVVHRARGYDGRAELLLRGFENLPRTRFEVFPYPCACFDTWKLFVADDYSEYVPIETGSPGSWNTARYDAAGRLRDASRS